MNKIVAGIVGGGVIGILLLMGFSYGGSGNPSKCGSKGGCGKVSRDCRDGGGCPQDSVRTPECREKGQGRMGWRRGRCGQDGGGIPTACSEARGCAESSDCGKTAACPDTVCGCSGKYGCGEDCPCVPGGDCGCACGECCPDMKDCEPSGCGASCGEARRGCRPSQGR